MITVLIKQEQMRFEEVLYSQINVKGEALTVQVLKQWPNPTNQTIIYYKGPLKAMLSIIKKDPYQNYQNDIDRFSKKGIHAVGIAKKEIDGEEAAEFLNQIQSNLSSTYHKQGMSSNDNLLIHFAYNVELVGIIGFKSVINNRNSLLLDEVRRNGIKVFMLSTDDAQINITDCNAMKLFQELNTPINVTGNTDRQVEDSLKQCLKQIVDKRWVDPK